MYVEELYGLKLAAKMAVLSACNTGRGLMSKRRGYTSIHQAFTFAGVPTTLSSLWEVPDQATQQIMKSFYHHLRTGLPKALALQKAKQDYIKNCQDPNLSLPFFWAGFVLTGDTSPLEIAERHAWSFYLKMGGLMLLLIGFGIWYRRRSGDMVRE